MKKGILFIALLMLVTLFLPSCVLLMDSGSGNDDFFVEDDVVDEVVRYEIIFDSAGGTAVASQTVLYGEKIKKPSNPTKSNDSKYEYSFDGWYFGDYAWDFETDTVCEDITLTAKWKIESEYTNPFLPSD